MRLRATLTILFALAMVAAGPPRPDGNRLTYLDGNDPYYPGLTFPKLVTPQWVGEEGVQAVVVLAVDDMRDPAKYETFLRPILDRLKAIDGRAPVSIMTNEVKPDDPRLQGWLKEGLNFDAHTLAHPCPLLQKGDFAAAKRTYDGCVDLLSQIPGNRPVAFRMPCCDSLNTPSPRFFAEIFNKTTARRRHLSIDSSVFNVITPADPALPRTLVEDADGGEKFRKYLPFPSFVNTIENYPYPYVIGRTCWEFPCVVPSDWEAQNVQGKNNPRTVDDLKSALDAVVLKQGVFNLVFHPHGWIKSEQVVELIDHAVKSHGKKVKFLNFREAQERIDKNLLGGEPIRDEKGRDNGVRVLDVDNDGYMDVVVANAKATKTRIWRPKGRTWKTTGFPRPLVTRDKNGLEMRWGAFGCVDGSGKAAVAFGDHFSAVRVLYRFMEDGPPARPRRATVSDPGPDSVDWYFDEDYSRGLHLGRSSSTYRAAGSKAPRVEAGDHTQGLRMRDLDGDGRCEIIASNNAASHVLAWSSRAVHSHGGPANRAPRKEDLGPLVPGWTILPIKMPPNAWLADSEGRDGGVRFVDLDEDGHDDIVFSRSPADFASRLKNRDPSRYGIFLFDSMTTGWSRKVLEGESGDPNALPLIARDGTDNGFWAHSRQLWWQNEDTAKLPDLVDRRSFNDLLKNVAPRGKTAEAARDAIRVRPGFRVEVAASEPQVLDPIAFDWGADGRLWVVEMGDYPLGVDGKGKPGGQVRTLEDTDGDGRYDKATVFLDGLGFPTGLMPWRRGVLVASAPDIFYAEDRDGDGRADHREVLFTGFHPGNQQHRLNGFELGLDGWIYGANGDSGGVVRSLKTGNSVDIRGRDFRFRPDTGEFEAESGQTQYGRHRDDWGRWFGNNNPTWAWHYVLSEPDLKRNTRFAPPDPKRSLEADTRLFPVSRTVPRFNDPGAADRATSANSPTPYRDDLFGPHFKDSLFVSEPVHNLVHRMTLAPDGATLRGARAVGEAKREFLASADGWFRPTMLKTGPDGALWVADMDRAVIEHPEWIPDDWEKTLDLRAGSDRGRIFRVVPVDKTPRTIPRLDRMDTAGLVAALDAPGGWQRDTAHRLLLHRNDPAAAKLLTTLVVSTNNPKARVQALWVLENLGALTPEPVLVSLRDGHPQVRRNSVRAARALLAASPAVGDAVLALADDPDPSVRFELALALGDWPNERAGRTLAAVALRDGRDPWVRAAVLSSAAPHAGTLLTALFAGPGPPPAGLVEPLFALAETSRGGIGLVGLIRTVGTPRASGKAFAPWQFSALAGLLDASARSGKPLASAVEGHAQAAAAVQRLDALYPAARELLADPMATVDHRLAAASLLGRDPRQRDAEREAVADLIRPQVPAPVQLAAVSGVGRGHDPKLPDALLSGWRGFSPAVRSAVLDTLLSRNDWTGSLLSSLEDTCTPPAEIDPAHRRRLLGHADKGVRDRAGAVFGLNRGDRAEVLAAYRSALKRAGDPSTGFAVFRRACAGCHKLGELGVEVGPDLAALEDRSPEAILTAVLDPNRAFEAKYTEFTVQLTDGRVKTGLIASETAAAVTLRRVQGEQDVILRADIESLSGSGRSLMPEGLEKDLTPRDLADLIALLAATRHADGPKTLPGNRPEVVAPRADGRVILPASAAEVFGDSLTFEAKYGNLGFWTANNDRAAWSFVAPHVGRYEVWLDLACDDGPAGQALTVRLAGSTLTYSVAGTGSWDQYRRVNVGTVALPAGSCRLEVGPAGPLRGPLLDLRSVELRPAPGSCCP